MDGAAPPLMGPGGFIPSGFTANNDFPRVSSPLPFDGHQRSSLNFVEPLQDDIGAKGSKKKDKKGNVDKSPLVEKELVGYSFQKAPALPGQQSTWARVGKRELPFDSKRLEAMVKEHRKRTRAGPTDDWAQLGPRQQGIVNRVLEEHRSNEKNANAEWVMVAAIRNVQRHFARASETVRMQVILKRFDKREAKIGTRTGVLATGVYNDTEIIDLADPSPTKKAENGNKKKKSHQAENSPIGFEDLPGFGNQPYVEQQQPGGHQQHDAQPRHSDPPQHFEQPKHFDQPQHFDPSQNFDQLFDQGHQFPSMNGPRPVVAPFNQPVENRPPSLLQHQDPFTVHPFQPNPEFAHPGQYSPMLGARHDLPRARIQSRPSTPHRPRSSSARRLRQLENVVQDLRQERNNLQEDLESVRDKIENWRLSSDGSQYEDDVFSQNLSGGYSTPPSETSFDNRARENLRRRKSSAQRADRTFSPSRSRERGYRAARKHNCHYQHYRDGRVYIQPAKTYPRREERYSFERERPRYVRPPRLHRSNTIDDYPPNPVPESAYTPPLSQPRLTNYPEGYELADFNDHRRARQLRRRGDFDLHHGVYENWRAHPSRDYYD